MADQTSPRFIVQATCTTGGSSLAGETSSLWFGASEASAKQAMARLQEAHRGSYRDWHIVRSEPA